MAGPWEDFAPKDDAKPWDEFAQKKDSSPPAAQQVSKGSGGLIGGAVEPIVSVATGLLAKPVSDVAGLARLGMEGLRHAGVPGIDEKDPLTVKRDVQTALTYEPRTAAGQAVMVPLEKLGEIFSWISKNARELAAPPDTSGPVRTAFGHGVEEAVNQAPAFIGLKTPAAAASMAKTGLESGARELMQSALKPTIKALETGKAAKAITTLLDEGINVTGGGAETLRGRIDKLNTDIATLVQNSPATVSASVVSARLQPLLDRFQKQVNPLSDVAAIQKAWNEFTNHPMIQNNQLSVPMAQELKQGTYRALGDKSYGELKGAEIEAQKALARGLKEEIANAVPAVRQLNAEESKMLNALSLVERRALISANKNPIGLGWLTVNPKHFVAYMADRSELFKSLIARMLHTGSKAVPDMTVAGPLGGLAVTEQANLPPNDK